LVSTILQKIEDKRGQGHNARHWALGESYGDTLKKYKSFKENNITMDKTLRIWSILEEYGINQCTE